ncbi:MAG: hypothetical protein GVY07_17020 [Bacteroidetes bacterium]|jgi:hypothetical protein|nr:hypothetical protein [Bacteroidota bacterium]
MNICKGILFTALFLLLFSTSVFAQLERKRVVQNPDVVQTFMAPRNINFYTVESLSPGELHYSIMHTFGEVKSGPGSLWGIDNGANVRFSFEYGITDRLSLGFGRSSLDRVYDFTSRIAILRQKTNNSIPVSISLIPMMGINTLSLDFLDQPYNLSDRLNFSVILPIARKFNDKLSIQFMPVYSHFNRVGPELNLESSDINDYFGTGVGARYKFTRSSAVTFQFVHPFSEADNLEPNLAIGIDIETGGHVFQMFFSTTRALSESYIIAGSNGNFFEREFRFGFNINRLFSIRR